MSHFRRLLNLIVAAAIFGTSSLSLVHAQNNNKAGNGLSISPTRSDLRITPGDSTTIKLTIKNVSGSDVQAQPVVNDFESDGVTGNPKIIVDEKQAPKTSITQFLPQLADLNLTKDQKVDLSIDVKVPKGTPAGAYYGVLRYDVIPAGSTAPKKDQVALQASVGTLILIEVPGDINESISIISIKPQYKGKEKSFFTAKPDHIVTLIKNTGNGFAQPVGKVTINNMFGKETASYELNNTSPRGNILPGSSRLFTDAIKGFSLPGKYTLTGNIAYGEGREVTTVKTSFWYMPVWASIVLIILVLLIIGAIVFVYRKMQSSGRG